MSQRAAELLTDIEKALNEASVARGNVQQATDRTDFVVTAVQTSLQKVSHCHWLYMDLKVGTIFTALLGSE